MGTITMLGICLLVIYPISSISSISALKVFCFPKAHIFGTRAIKEIEPKWWWVQLVIEGRMVKASGL
jgi:hypothetical protein